MQGGQINFINLCIAMTHFEPGLYYKNNDMKTLSEDVWQGYHKCVERMLQLLSYYTSFKITLLRLNGGCNMVIMSQTCNNLLSSAKFNL
ncbi:hypothetical protein H5410_005336 [Solanum commersonii]|uniref:Uncharacterized protein n=1 Tax=Solanum commersonii TaxID=4109 RepID=A0A9J6A643_SOLCO|nr:hypothetical protein H5410_005336 [Solanum commersonii]